MARLLQDLWLEPKYIFVTNGKPTSFLLSSLKQFRIIYLFICFKERTFLTRLSKQASEVLPK